MIADELERSRHLANGQYYLLIHRRTKLALSLKKQDKQKVVLEKQNENEVRQIWMVEQISNSKWQIINFITSFVLTSDSNNKIKLQKGQQKSSQLYNIVCIESDKYSIMQTQPYSLYVDFKDSLVKDKLESIDNQPEWEFKPISHNSVIDSTFFIQSAYSLKVVDVPSASTNKGTVLIQYRCNNRSNQRWSIEEIERDNKPTKQYFIRSLISNMSLDIKHGHMKEGNPVIQWSYEKQTNQQWKIQYQGNNLYLIRSLKDEEYVLSIAGNSFNDQATLCITKPDDYSYWKILSSIK